ncbi:MAG: hypothetical protein ACLPKT_10360, partial [Methylocella sp.]
AGLHYSGFRPVSGDRYEQSQSLSQCAWSENSLRRGRIREVGLTGANLIYIDDHIGALGGDLPEHREQLKRDVIETLSRMGLDTNTLKEVENGDRVTLEKK